MSRYAKPAASRHASGVRRIAAALAGLALLGLTACASGPEWEPEAVDESVTPAVAQAEGRSLAGTAVRWGGVIVSVQNRDEGSDLEVLAYPLDRRDRPRSEADPYGRVLVRYDDFLEPVVYAEGREVTFQGEVVEPRTIRIGDARREVPAVTADQLHLWDRRDRRDGGSRIHFGVGVGIIR